MTGAVHRIKQSSAALRPVAPLPAEGRPDLAHAMTSGGNRNGLSGTGDTRPMVYRAGALDANQWPSRMGHRLYYRDGRVEVIE